MLNVFYSITKKDNKRLELKRILRMRLQEKYGLYTEDYIAERLEEEWRAVERLGLLEHVWLLEKLVQWLNKNQYPYWLRGTAGASLMLYLLGITRSNPLPPHYYCPSCRKVMWMMGCKDGFDLVDSQICKDKKLMLGDGHDLPWQNIWGVRKGYLEIDLPKQLYPLISRYYSIHYGRKKYLTNQKGRAEILPFYMIYLFFYENDLRKLGLKKKSLFLKKIFKNVVYVRKKHYLCSVIKKPLKTDNIWYRQSLIRTLTKFSMMSSRN